ADAMTGRLRDAFEHWHDVSSLQDHEVAALAQRLQLDIAVDLTGHTTGARTDIFALRCAPAQMGYLGFPGSMGARFFDYMVADRHLVPDGEHDGYTEKVVYLPHCFQINDNKRVIAATSTRADHGLHEKAFVFCAFGNGYKLTPQLYAEWMRILR